jgi:hypothetical protein
MDKRISSACHHSDGAPPNSEPKRSAPYKRIQITFNNHVCETNKMCLQFFFKLHSGNAVPKNLTLSFSFHARKKVMWVSISVSRGDRHCHKGSRMGPSCKYLSAVFPAAIPMLPDLRSSQHLLFWGRTWICINKCMWVSCNMVWQYHSPRNYWLQ